MMKTCSKAQSSPNTINRSNQIQQTQTKTVSVQPRIEVPDISVPLPPVQGSTTFWTIIAIAILAKVIVGYPTEPRK